MQKNSAAVESVWPPKRYSVQRCEIKGGGQEMAGIVRRLMPKISLLTI